MAQAIPPSTQAVHRAHGGAPWHTWRSAPAAAHRAHTQHIAARFRLMCAAASGRARARATRSPHERSAPAPQPRRPRRRDRARGALPAASAPCGVRAAAAGRGTGRQPLLRTAVYTARGGTPRRCALEWCVRWRRPSRVLSGSLAIAKPPSHLAPPQPAVRLAGGASRRSRQTMTAQTVSPGDRWGAVMVDQPPGVTGYSPR